MMDLSRDAMCMQVWTRSSLLITRLLIDATDMMNGRVMLLDFRDPSQRQQGRMPLWQRKERRRRNERARTE